MYRRYLYLPMSKSLLNSWLIVISQYWYMDLTPGPCAGADKLPKQFLSYPRRVLTNFLAISKSTISSLQNRHLRRRDFVVPLGCTTVNEATSAPCALAPLSAEEASSVGAVCCGVPLLRSASDTEQNCREKETSPRSPFKAKVVFANFGCLVVLSEVVASNNIGGRH